MLSNRLKQYRPLLEENFSSVGISGTYGLFMRESFDQFRLFCSGRKNCRGMLFDFKVLFCVSLDPQLKKRQDLFSLLLDFITPVDDIMVFLLLCAYTQTVDIPLDPESVQPFVFALCRKRDYKSVHSENGDLVMSCYGFHSRKTWAIRSLSSTLLSSPKRADTGL